MYQISENIREQGFTDLNVKKLFSKEQVEVLSISLAEGSKFPEHTSPRDAFLVMLEGEVSFYINNEVYPLKKYQTFNFPAGEPHSVKAGKNSRFLIVR